MEDDCKIIINDLVLLKKNIQREFFDDAFEYETHEDCDEVTLIISFDDKSVVIQIMYDIEDGVLTISDNDYCNDIYRVYSVMDSNDDWESFHNKEELYTYIKKFFHHIEPKRRLNGM